MTRASGKGGAADQQAAVGAASPWRPLRTPLFRNLLLADVMSDIGTFMQTVGAAWLMVSLGAGPMYVALTQTASAPETVTGATVAALRYVRFSPQLRAVDGTHEGVESNRRTLNNSATEAWRRQASEGSSTQAQSRTQSLIDLYKGSLHFGRGHF